NFTANGTISGAGDVTLGGAGEVVPTATNTFTGNWQLNAGTLRVANQASLGNSNNDLVFDGGQFNYTGPSVTLPGGRLINAVGAGTIRVDASDAVLRINAGSQIAGSGNLTKAGPGVLWSSQDQATTGTWQLLEGTLRIGNAAHLGAGNSVFLDGGTLEFD